MYKIHPQAPISCSDSDLERETFTIWMKSLVFHGNGCTVFNSKGQLVFRVDNYQRRYSSKVFLMDSCGQILYSINRKQIFGCCEVYKWVDWKTKEEKQSFEVQRSSKIFSKDYKTWHVTIRRDRINRRWLNIIEFEGKSTFKITEDARRLLAEVMQKQSTAGVPLGDDVLSLVVEPQIDRTLMMAIVTVYGLINGKL